MTSADKPKPGEKGYTYLTHGGRQRVTIILEADSRDPATKGEGPGWCLECGKALTTEEAIRSDACLECDPASGG